MIVLPGRLSVLPPPAPVLNDTCAKAPGFSAPSGLGACSSTSTAPAFSSTACALRVIVAGKVRRGYSGSESVAVIPGCTSAEAPCGTRTNTRTRLASETVNSGCDAALPATTSWPICAERLVTTPLNGA